MIFLPEYGYLKNSRGAAAQPPPPPPALYTYVYFFVFHGSDTSGFHVFLP